MIHNGRGTRSTIISKGISAGFSNNTYRGLVRVAAGAEGVRNFTQCDSLAAGRRPAGRTRCPISRCAIPVGADRARGDDEQDQRRPAVLCACNAGWAQEAAVALIVNGFAKEVLQQLPMEFAVEAQKLLGISVWKDRSDDLVPARPGKATKLPSRLQGRGRGWRHSAERMDDLRQATPAKCAASRPSRSHDSGASCPARKWVGSSSAGRL